MKASFIVVASLCLAVFAKLALGQTDPSYDHQTVTYNSQFKPASVQGAVEVTPFFSPDNSINTLTDLVMSAQFSIDVATPGFESWNGCTAYGKSCVGCDVSFLAGDDGETFPIWRALLNAIHRNVTVRIVTNNYNTPDCAGQISPLTYLAVAGAQVQFYTSTTFIHTKYISVDKRKSAVSSVNFSYTSFMKNREAGMLISGDDSSELLGFLNDVFEYDFNHGNAYVAQSYTADQMQIIQNPAQISVNIPSTVSFSCKYQSPTPVGVSSSSLPVTVMASPDFSYSTVMQALQSAQSSIVLSIYQITSKDFCNLLATSAANGLNVQIFVSDAIYAQDDYAAAQVCYKSLYNQGVTIRKSKKDCLTYSHQKYWIIDGETVYLSTGNWSPTDYPDQSVFPVFGSSGWADTNRDFSVSVKSKQLVDIFTQVFNTDYSQGYDYYPY